jgi:predicted RNA polymerase sigma factor
MRWRSFLLAALAFLQRVEGVKELKGVFDSLPSRGSIGTRITRTKQIYADFENALALIFARCARFFTKS